SDRAARRIDPVEQGRSRDGPALPDLGHQLVLADHPVAVPDQVNDQIEDLRLERQRLRPAPQFAALGVERAVVELALPNPAPVGETGAKITRLVREKWRRPQV